LSIAVLAVDPSSQVSGGALLGDRTRMRFTPDERRLFFRSQASESDLGGLGPSSFQVCRLLTRLFDCVMIETVGIGQSEADIRHLADRVYLVLQPLGGDEVQFLKAGIIEVPHAFILNKSDEPSSAASYHQLRSSMWLARPFDEDQPPIFRTSALTGAGLEELEADLLVRVRAPGAAGLAEREPYFFERWVDDEWGRVGRRFLAEQLGGAATYLADRVATRPRRPRSLPQCERRWAPEGSQSSTSMDGTVTLIGERRGGGPGRRAGEGGADLGEREVGSASDNVPASVSSTTDRTAAAASNCSETPMVPSTVSSQLSESEPADTVAPGRSSDAPGIVTRVIAGSSSAGATVRVPRTSTEGVTDVEVQLTRPNNENSVVTVWGATTISTG
jgi:hypothetical protein